MKKGTIDIDQKLQLITKIKTGLRRQKIEHISFLEGNSVQLPPINNILMSFPNKQQQRGKFNTTIHTPPKKKIQLELEQFFSYNEKGISGNDINRIVFASPIKTRYSFDKTIFRSSATLSLEANSRSKKCLLQKNTKKYQQKWYQQKIIHFKPSNSTEVKKVVSDNPIDLIRSIFQQKRQYLKANTKIEWSPSLRLQVSQKKIKNERLSKADSYKNEHRLQRFSPWVSKQMQDQLVV